MFKLKRMIKFKRIELPEDVKNNTSVPDGGNDDGLDIDYVNRRPQGKFVKKNNYFNNGDDEDERGLRRREFGGYKKRDFNGDRDGGFSNNRFGSNKFGSDKPRNNFKRYREDRGSSKKDLFDF